MSDETLIDCPTCDAAVPLSTAACPYCGETLLDDPPSPAVHDDEFDYVIEQIGEWSAVKHEIVDRYLQAYTRILSKQSFVSRITYIDAFAGTGFAELRESGQLVLGSAMRAMLTEPPFTELHFIEKDPERAKSLRYHARESGDSRVVVHAGDCVDVLLNDVLPRCQWSDRARAVCLLDPYGLQVPWSLLEHVGQMKSVEIFYNFMVVGANRNVLWTSRERVTETQKMLLDQVWGDRSWEQAAYSEQIDLFGQTRSLKRSNEQIVEAFRKRLKSKTGFNYVPQPIPIRNSRGATLYYLFFAGPNNTGASIVEDIFAKFR